MYNNVHYTDNLYFLHTKIQSFLNQTWTNFKTCYGKMCTLVKRVILVKCILLDVLQRPKVSVSPALKAQINKVQFCCSDKIQASVSSHSPILLPDSDSHCG